MHRPITHEINRFVEGWPLLKGAVTRWGEPLVGFADATDPLFLELKRAVSPSHALPGDLLRQARTVVVYFLPFDKGIAKSNRRGPHASEAWATAYVETNQLIRDVNDRLAEVLEQAGFRTSLLPPTHNFDEDRLISDWSHKHVAYIAGLGTFGLHHLLITKKGCCGRLGSLVTDAQAQPTLQPEREACLYKFNGTCHVCVKRCVNGALQEEGFDRHKCYAMLLQTVEIHRKVGYADVCGKCSTVVPCSFSDPVSKLLKARNRAS